ncbi:MAG TPA: hypothetical protein VML54_09330 [Candidatus Limnocylindrales bacterium]|nr:hypothetical protein [Candidatus Limnocylindrales bacterium]
MAMRSQYRRLFEVALPMYSLAVVVFYFRPQYLPPGMAGSAESVMLLALWGLVGAMSGVLALSGLTVAFFLLYSPLYLLARSWTLVGKGGWVDRRELRFYAACFILLCFLGGLAVLSPLAAASVFVMMAGSAHLLWRVLA